MGKICIIQTGRLGDTIIALPIAKYYNDNGYIVDWVIHESLKGIFNYIDYVNNIKIIPNNIDIMFSIPEAYKLIENENYTNVIDLSIGFPGSLVSKYTDVNFLETFVHVKYYLANVDINKKWDFKFNRNIERENSLYEKLVNKDYVLIHNTISDSKTAQFSVETEYDKIYFEKIEDYEIFDWYKIILNAKEIYCIDSSLCNFIDVVSDFSKIKKFFCGKRTDNTTKWLQPPLKNWIEYK
jgi:hypothetical protein